MSEGLWQEIPEADVQETEQLADELGKRLSESLINQNLKRTNLF